MPRPTALLRAATLGVVMVAALLVGTPRTALAQAGAIIASIGANHIERAGTAHLAIRHGDVVQSGDVLQTGADGRLQVRFSDGAIVSLQPSTRFRVDKYQYDGGTRGLSFMTLLRGALRTASGLIGKGEPDHYEMRSPSATVGIRGTQYMLEQTACDPVCSPGASAGLLIRVTEGRIVVRNAAGSVQMSAGESGRVDGPGLLPQVGGPGPLLRPAPYQPPGTDERRVASGPRKATIPGPSPLAPVPDDAGTVPDPAGDADNADDNGRAGREGARRPDGPPGRGRGGNLSADPVREPGNTPGRDVAQGPGEEASTVTDPGKPGGDPEPSDELGRWPVAASPRAPASGSPNDGLPRDGESSGQAGAGKPPADLGERNEFRFIDHPDTREQIARDITEGGELAAVTDPTRVRREPAGSALDAGDPGTPGSSAGSGGSPDSGGSTGSGGNPGDGSSGSDDAPGSGLQLPGGGGQFAAQGWRIDLRAVPVLSSLGLSTASEAAIRLDENLALAAIGHCPTLLCLSRGTAQLAEAGHNDSVTWGRWQDGTADLSVLGIRSRVELADNHGLHYLVGSPPVSLPANGTFGYMLSGATAPTMQPLGYAPGLFSGSAAVRFDAGLPSRVGLQGQVDIAGEQFHFQTPGGVADAGASPLTLNASQRFEGVLPTTGGAGLPWFCEGHRCSATVSGALLGPAGEHLGLGYSIRSHSGSTTIDGVGVFTRP